MTPRSLIRGATKDKGLFLKVLKIWIKTLIPKDAKKYSIRSRIINAPLPFSTQSIQNSFKYPTTSTLLRLLWISPLYRWNLKMGNILWMKSLRRMWILFGVMLYFSTQQALMFTKWHCRWKLNLIDYSRWVLKNFIKRMSSSLIMIRNLWGKIREIKKDLWVFWSKKLLTKISKNCPQNICGESGILSPLALKCRTKIRHSWSLIFPVWRPRRRGN